MLTSSDIKTITECLEKGTQVPEGYRDIIFPTQKIEYELTYSGKMRKEDVLANDDGTFPVPLQIEKIYNSTEYKTYEDGWRNIIVFGDNLQFLKTINENKDPIIKDKVKGKVKLIYIDPPFATDEDFDTKEGVKAYTDKKKGAAFIEFIRRRLIVAKEILADDGVIYVHLDWKKVHYIKVVMDEIFGESNYKNEIIWKYFGPTSTKRNYPRKHDVILFYAKSNEYYFNNNAILIDYDEKAIKRYDKVDENGDAYKLYYDDDGSERRAYMKEGKPTEVFEIPFVQGTSKERIGYPTQKPEALLSRIIEASTKEGDLIIDFFSGSGTTLAVAEKLGRKWIGCDIGKLSYFTSQKRILQIQKSKCLENPKKTYGEKAKSFMTCSLGLYDLKKALELEWKMYITFVSGLFGIEIKNTKVSGFKFDGKIGEYYVKIFDYQKYKDSEVDEDYIKGVHSIVGNRVADRVYIVAPVNYVAFLSDYYELDGIKYYFLKIPYHMIKELHQKPFQKYRQPKSINNVNSLDEAIGFHFIRQPEVSSEINIKGTTVNIIIKKFISQELDSDKSKEEKQLKNFESISAVFIDENYNGKTFEMTRVLFADELKQVKGKDVVIKLPKADVGEEIMIIYTDIYGNDFTEIFNLNKEGGDHE